MLAIMCVLVDLPVLLRVVLMIATLGCGPRWMASQPPYEEVFTGRAFNKYVIPKLPISSAENCRAEW